MMYLDHGATSFHKPEAVAQAMVRAIKECANPSRGGYPAAMKAAQWVYGCREQAGKLFECQPEQVVFTSNCTHALNIAISTLVKPGAKVVISGFEHNAVVRPLHMRRAKITVAGRKLFDWENTLEEFEKALRLGADAAVITHVSNVFGYILPIEELALLCKQYGVPLIVDAAQSAGILPVSLEKWQADFIAMPGHKGLLGPQGTGLLLCNRKPEPLFAGGTGSDSRNRLMPEDLPDRAEAGTLNVPGIAGLAEGICYIRKLGTQEIFRREHMAAKSCIHALQELGVQVFAGQHQAGTVSFVPEMDVEVLAQRLAERGVAVRGGLHCAPLAHESADTLDTGTVRVSFGHDSTCHQGFRLGEILRKCME